MSEELSRISVTLPPDLLTDFDEVIDGWDYDSRSEAVRDALRAYLTEYRQQTNLASVQRGSVVLLYDHHDGNVNQELIDLQHDLGDVIVAVQHVHLSDHLCMETIVVDGTGQEIRELANHLRSLRGIQQVKLAVVDASG